MCTASFACQSSLWTNKYIDKYPTLQNTGTFPTIFQMYTPLYSIHIYSTLSMWVAALFVAGWVTGECPSLRDNSQHLHDGLITTCHLNRTPIHRRSLRVLEVSEALQTAIKAWDVHETADSTHRSLVPNLAERLFISDIFFGPAVGDHVAGDGWVVDGQRSFPAHN